MENKSVRMKNMQMTPTLKNDDHEFKYEFSLEKHQKDEWSTHSLRAADLKGS